MQDNGISNIESLEDARNFVNLIDKQWIIDKDYVMGKTIKHDENAISNIGAKNKQYDEAVIMQKTGENSIQFKSLFCGLESEIPADAPNYDGMSKILNNGNRVEEILDVWNYNLTDNGNAELVSTYYKNRYSTLNKEQFQKFQQRFQENSLPYLKETAEKPETYWENDTIYENNKAEYMSKDEFIKNGNKSKIEKQIPKEKQIRRNAEDLYNLAMEASQGDKLLYKEIIISHSLTDLGVDPDMLKRKEIRENINNMVQLSIENNPELENLDSVESIEKLQKQLSNDLVIGKNFISGKINKYDRHSVEFGEGEKGKDYDNTQVITYYTDENNKIHEEWVYMDTVTNLQRDEFKNSPYAYLSEQQELMENDNVSKITSRHNIYDKEQMDKPIVSKDRIKILTTQKDQFKANGFEELTIEEALQIGAMPDEYFDKSENVTENEKRSDIIAYDLLGKSSTINENGQHFYTSQNQHENYIQENAQINNRGILENLLNAYDMRDITQNMLGSAVQLIQQTKQNAKQFIVDKIKDSEGER